MNFQGLISDDVVVSKLCCPCCWELMGAFKVLDLRAFCVRGRHSTVHPVHLPPWLDDRVVSYLVKRYEDLLYEALCEMWRRKEEASLGTSWPRISMESHTSATGSVKSSHSQGTPTSENTIGLFEHFLNLKRK